MQWAWAMVAALGIVVAAVTTWQRDRDRFNLAKLALEKGISSIPGMPPAWVRSMRSALSILIVGIGLIIVGAAAWGMTVGGQSPEEAMVAADQAMMNESPTTHPALALPVAPPMDRSTDRPGPRSDRPGPPPRHEMRPPPPVFSPAMERWHQARERENQRTVGQACVAVGFILALLGLVRMGAAGIERRYIGERGGTDSEIN